ncbi:MAG TPA: hypothetical protein VMU16_15605 [Candidatus Binataceae bacterium]|nr:hypothetical protein [Candidatus Binataceae bacterium]
MNALMNHVENYGLGNDENGSVVSEGMRLAALNLLNELPVAIFGMLTVAYLASSLLSLIR